MKNKLFVAGLALLFCLMVRAQSASVFDAAYFNKSENTTPPLKIGKGFHINDVYRMTRNCFTAESSGQDKLTAQQTGGVKTSIRIYHTYTNAEYNTFKRTGTSGKIGFLNLFSIGGQKLDEYANKDVTDEERIIFVANVDFGMYSFGGDLVLTNEAQDLIKQKKLPEFVKFFGTHYINGIRKESSIVVILTRKNTSNDFTVTNETGFGAGGKRSGIKAGLSTESTDKVNTVLRSGTFSVEVEINGPSIDGGMIKGSISKILNGPSQTKAEGVASMIEGAMKNISDPNQALITQYYYAPFDLYGLEGIYWDEKRQNELSRLNEAIIDVYSAKSNTDEVCSPSGKQQFIDELTEGGVSADDQNTFLEVYNTSLPEFKKINTKAATYLKELEIRYNKCADVFCANNTTCCTNEAYLKEIETYNFQGKITDEENALYVKIAKKAEEVYKPECEKNETGKIIIKNLSTNPYSLYSNGKFLQTIEGKSSVEYNVSPGTYSFKAVQDSGYLMYATENKRTATIVNACEEVTVKVGFED